MSEVATKALQPLKTGEVERLGARKSPTTWQPMCVRDRAVNHTGKPNGAQTDRTFSAEALTGVSMEALLGRAALDDRAARLAEAVLIAGGEVTFKADEDGNLVGIGSDAYTDLAAKIPNGDTELLHP